MPNEIKNNFNKKVQMHLACSKDNGFDPETECIFFNDGYAYATDTHILVRNRISEISGLNEAEIEALNGKFLHAGFYRDMLKYDSIMIAEDGIECSKGNDRAFFYFSLFEKYPDAEKALQDALNKQTVPLPQFSFDMKLMQRLNKALYQSDCCTATFKGVGNPIVFASMDAEVSSVGLFATLINLE